jgi:hypothetical protein
MKNPSHIYQVFVLTGAQNVQIRKIEIHIFYHHGTFSDYIHVYMRKEEEKTLLENVSREAPKTAKSKAVRSTETSTYLGKHLQIFRW